jgi:aspartyl-tRNA(Asn)/glutamyl-tRNA(Gln) amidotransferase subunit B
MSWQDKYEAVIGLEVHAELKTNSKMFCGCVNDPFKAEQPNTYTCPVCLGMPGGLPVPNKKAIEWTLKIGLAAGCKINHFSKFDRKHYFYPDLAKGYQISQYDIPFCHDGKMNTNDGQVRIRRIHLEEDTGKLLHQTVDGKQVSLIDFNRSGIPLVEIVTEPDIISGAQAKEFGKKLRQLLRWLDVADCDMEQGGMRLEANISLRKKGRKELPNYKVEIKNINSFRFMQQAIDYDLSRQAELLDKGETPAQETRGWNANKNRTFSQRGKEEAEDYRYFPEPDIPPFHFEEKFIEKIRSLLPKLPEEVAQRWQQEFNLHPKQIAILLATDSKAEISWLEKVLNLISEKKLDTQLFANDLINKKLNADSTMKAEEVVTAFEKLHDTEDIDDDRLAGIIAEVLENNQDAVIKYQAGQQQVLGFLMGQVLKEVNKKVDPKKIREALKHALEA